MYRLWLITFTFLLSSSTCLSPFVINIIHCSNYRTCRLQARYWTICIFAEFILLSYFKVIYLLFNITSFPHFLILQCRRHGAVVMVLPSKHGSMKGGLGADPLCFMPETDRQKVFLIVSHVQFVALCFLCRVQHNNIATCPAQRSKH